VHRWSHTMSIERIRTRARNDIPLSMLSISQAVVLMPSSKDPMQVTTTCPYLIASVIY
jgi:hypothetical protein